MKHGGVNYKELLREERGQNEATGESYSLFLHPSIRAALHHSLLFKPLYIPPLNLWEGDLCDTCRKQNVRACVCVYVSLKRVLVMTEVTKEISLPRVQGEA